MCLFKKKDNFLSQMKKTEKLLSKSFNYKYVFYALKGMFFETDFEVLYDNPIMTKSYLEFINKIVIDQFKFKQDKRFLNLKFYFGKNDNGLRSIIVEFGNKWKLETECNFVALCMNADGEKFMYTSEYYETSKAFYLCKQMLSTRQSYDLACPDLQSFLNNIDQVIV